MVQWQHKKDLGGIIYGDDYDTEDIGCSCWFE